MIRLGLTGTLGAGKSTVGRLFQSWGGWRIDADVLAREAVAIGTPGHAAVLAQFGDAVRAPDGAIDRAALRNIVFADPRARFALEAIVHPEVDRLREAELARAAAAGADVVVFEIPLLFEKGIEREFDRIVTVDAPVEVRRRRVVESRGLTPEEFAAIDATQWSAERKRDAADVVILNDADEQTLAERARDAWEAVTLPVWQIDLHMHTSASADCRSDPADVVGRARDIGLDRIAITDHDEIRGAFAAHEIDPELVIVGEEVRTSEGLDLIGLWLTGHIPPGGTFRETAAAIRAQGGVVYVPHPFDPRRGTDEAFLGTVADCIDAVEGFNARIHTASRNEQAVAWAERHDLPVGAGSDAHTLAEIGRARVRLPPFDGPESFLSSLHGGTIEGRASSPLVHLASTWAKLWP